MMMVIMLLKLAWERMTKAIFYSNSGKVGRQLGLIRPFITALSLLQLLQRKPSLSAALQARPWLLLFNKH